MVQALDDDFEIQPDLPQALRLLDEMNNNVKQVSDVVEGMLQRVKTGELSTEYGLSFLEIKYHMLLNYLINLTYVVLRKCSGQKIEKDPSIDRLIEIRTVLEKIRPIDHKLRYQIDKLVKTAVTGSTNSSDPLSFKANPDNLQMANSSDESSEEEDEDDGSKKFKKKSKKDKNLDDEETVAKYVPPKVISMPYDDETAAEKEEKQKERMKKRAYNSSMIEEWKEEFLDTPVEVAGGSRAQQMISKALKEKEEFEENYFVRLPMTKAEKHRQKRLSTLGTLGDELTRFNDSNDLEGNSSKGNRKRKIANKKRGGKKRKFH